MEYTETLKHTTEITIKPCELNAIDKHIEDKISKKIDSCTEKNGYIMDIKNIRIISNTISRLSGKCIFKVKYDIVSLKPQPGHVYVGFVNIIFKEGIFVEYHNIKILIPYTSMKNWVYKTSTYTLDDRTVSVGDWIKVLIGSVRYDNHTYQCIGSII